MAVGRLQCPGIFAERPPQPTYRLGQRVFVDNPARPARFEQAVLVDVFAVFAQQNRENGHAGAVEFDGSACNREPATRVVEFELAKTRHAAAHATPCRFLPSVPSEVEMRAEEHTSELQSLMRNSYAVFSL